MFTTDEIEGQSQQVLRERVARAVAGPDRREATQAREKAAAEEWAVAKVKAEGPPRRAWWRLRK
jgi:hypothetical protein